MHVENQTPDPLRIDRSTQTDPSIISDLCLFLTRSIKSICYHNFIWDIDEPEARFEIINNRRISMALAMSGTSCIGATCCAAGGLFMSHSCSQIVAEAIVGGIAGCQIGHMGEKEAHKESIRIEAHNNMVTSQPQRNSNQILSTLNNDVDNVPPPSYEESQLTYLLRQRGGLTGEGNT